MRSVDFVVTFQSENEKAISQIDSVNKLAFNLIYTNPLRSISIADENKSFAERLGYQQGFARSLSILGSAYWARAKYDVSMTYYLQALEVYETLNDIQGLSSCYNNIGEIYKKTGQMSRSLEYQMKVLQLYDGLDDLSLPPLTLNNIAEDYIYLEIYDSAEYFLNKALDLGKKNRDLRAIAYVLNNFGILYNKTGRSELSSSYFKESIDYWKQDNNPRGELITGLNQVELLIDAGSLDTANKMLKLIFEKSEEMDAMDLMVRSAFYQSKIDSINGTWEEAYISLSEFERLNSQLKDRESESLLLQLENEYILQKKDKEVIKINNQAKFNRFVIFGGGALLIMALLLAFLFFKKFRDTEKLRKDLEEKNKLIFEQKAEIQLKAKQLGDLNDKLEDLLRVKSNTLNLRLKQLDEYTFINSHRLRAPVASIVGIISIIKHEHLGSEGELLLGHLNSSVEELQKVVDEIGEKLGNDQPHN